MVHASFCMVLLHFKIVVVLLWFQKCSITAWNPADLTALGIYKRLFHCQHVKASLDFPGSLSVSIFWKCS